MPIEGNADGPRYVAPVLGQGASAIGRWPTTRDGIVREYERREAAYTGADYSLREVQDLNLFRALDNQQRVIATTRRITADLRYVVRVDAAAIATDGVALQVRPSRVAGGPEAADVALARGTQVWERSGVEAQLRRWALNTCVLGDWWLEVQRLPDAEGGGAVIVAHDPREVVADHDATGQRVRRLVVTTEYTDDGEIGPDGAWRGDPQRHTYRRVVTPERVDVYRDGRLVPEESGPNLLGVVPAVRVSYAPILSGHLSEWAGTGYEAAVAMIDSARTQVLSIVTRHANPILAVIGSRLAAGEDLQTISRTMSLPTGADVRWLEADLKGVDVALAQAEALRAALMQTLPEFLFVESGATASGTALGYRAGAFVAKIEPVRQAMYGALARCVGWAVAVDLRQRWSEAADVYAVDGGDALPMDVAASAALYTQLAAEGWLTGADVVARLQGLQLVSSDEDPAEYYARAQADLRARSGAGYDQAREVIAALQALEQTPVAAVPVAVAGGDDGSDGAPKDMAPGDAGASGASADGAAVVVDQPGAAVADTALNGAQADFILSAVSQVVAGQIPRSAAIAAVEAALPMVSRDLIARMFSDVVQGSGIDTPPPTV